MTQNGSTFEARTGFYGPKVELRYAKPTIRWEVWSEQGDVSAATMVVDGKTVATSYDPTSRSLHYTPPTPLTTGKHQVECEVTFKGLFKFKRHWQTTVAEKAMVELPEPSATQLELLAEANNQRQKLGLESFVMDKRMNAAAQSHAEYMANNHVTGHGERPTDPGFTGGSPSDRLEAYGWGGSSWEGLTYTLEGPKGIVANLYTAPYHRLPFLQPGTLQIGFGAAPARASALFQGSTQTAVVASPADGESGVPTTWDCRERPNPLRLHPGIEAPVGFPIMLAIFGKDNAALNVTQFTLTDAAGNKVDCLLNSPGMDDELTFAAFILPTKPLKSHTKYTVTFEGTNEKKSPIQKSWTFETGS